MVVHSGEVVDGAGAVFAEFLLLVTGHGFPVFLAWGGDVVLWVHGFYGLVFLVRRISFVIERMCGSMWLT